MKNLHLLPTNKPSIPSRLFYNEQESLIFSKKYSVFNGVNLYITSDEEIKEGDWLIDEKYLEPIKYYGLGSLLKTSRKIILTTDQDLIKEGIQEIDDEFLEWFVKNPTCEFVQVEKEYLSNSGEWKDVLLPSEWESDTEVRRRIIVPKEELERGIIITNVSKQETLEEVDENKRNLYFKKQVMNPYKVEDYSYTAYEKGFIEGYEESTKWQEQNSNVNALNLEIDALKKQIQVLEHNQENVHSKEQVIALLESVIEHPTKPGYRRHDVIDLIKKLTYGNK